LKRQPSQQGSRHPDDSQTGGQKVRNFGRCSELARKMSRRSVVRGAGGLAAFCVANGSLPGLVRRANAAEPLGQVDLYTWEGYELTKEMSAWREQNGLEINSVGFIGQQADVPGKILGPSGAGIDISSVNHLWIRYFNELGVFSPISASELPVLDRLFPKFKGAPWRNEDGSFNSVPWTWGPLGITYRSDKIDQPKSWNTLFEPAFKNRIGILDDPAHMGTAAVILGYQIDQLTQAQLSECKKYMQHVLKQAKTLSVAFGDAVSLLASGEIDVFWSGWPQIDVLIADKGGRAKTIVPSGERSQAFSDANFIPPGADNRAAALKFIEQTVSGSTAAEAAKSLAAGVTNPDVVSELDPSLKSLYPYDSIDSYFQQLVFSPGFPHGDSEFVTLDQSVKAWQEAKAGL
jgi:spermidine/putrescine-binding protein